MEKRGIVGTGEAFAAAATPRQQRLSSASWRLRARMYGFHYRRRIHVGMVDERHNNTRKSQERERSGEDPAIGSKTLHPVWRSLIARRPGHVTYHGLSSYVFENIGLHSRYGPSISIPLDIPAITLGWVFDRCRAVQKT